MANLDNRIIKLEAGSDGGPRRFVTAWQQMDDKNLFDLNTGEVVTAEELGQLQAVADVLVFRVSITA